MVPWLRRNPKRPVQSQAGGMAAPGWLARFVKYARLVICGIAAGCAVVAGEPELCTAVGVAILVELVGVVWSLPR